MNFFINLQKPVKILAPMVNNSGKAYRKLAVKHGADLCYTEMVHCQQFLQSKCDPKKNRWYEANDDGTPLVVQICGNDPIVMLAAAKKIEPFCNAIDLNFGCPQNIAKRGNYGAFLQNNPQKTGEIIKTLSTNLKVPVFCKIRIFDDIEKTLEYTKMIEQAGCSLIAVHGRTREQKGCLSGNADWDVIRKIKENAGIPIIGNGGILKLEDVNSMYELTKCDGVMVAEGHLYNPLIFTDNVKNCFEIMNEYFEFCKEIDTKMIEIKSHTFKILHGVLEEMVVYKEIINNSHDLDDLIRIVNEIKNEIYSRGLLHKTVLKARIRNIIPAVSEATE